jgi:hypothetical protein
MVESSCIGFDVTLAGAALGRAAAVAATATAAAAIAGIARRPTLVERRRIWV